MQYSPVLLVVFCSAFLLSAASFALALQSLFYPLPIDFADGLPYFINATTMYKSFSTQPYLLTYYPPLYYVVFNAFSFIRVNNAPFFYERLLELIAELASAFLVYLILKKGMHSSAFVSALGAFLFFSFYPLYYAVSSNPELFELCFSLFAVFLLLRKPRNYEYFAGLSVAVAFLFKQTAALFFIAMLAFLIMKDKKSALKFFLAFAILLGIICLPLTYYSEGRFFFSVFILPLVTPQYFLEIANMLVVPLLPLFFLIVFALSEPISKETLLLYVLLFVLFLTFVDIAKWGSNTTYFAPLIAVSSMLGTIRLNDLVGMQSNKRSKNAGNYPARLLLARAFALVLVFSLIADVYSNPCVMNAQKESELAELRSLSYLQGNILVEKPGYALIAGKPLVFEPSMFWVLHKKGLWNDSEILQQIKDRSFSAIVLQHISRILLYYNDTKECINESYHLVYNSTAFEVYEPD